MRSPILGLTRSGWLILIALTLLLVSLTLWPRIDLAISGLFYVPTTGFPANEHWFFNLLHDLAFKGARLLGVGLIIGVLIAWLTRRKLCGLDAKAMLFVLLALLLGPGLVANEIFKDEWGRARPRTVVEFGGTQQFTPPLVIASECERNCSFVSGDASFGFFLPSLAFVAAVGWRRRCFWGGMAAGAIFGGARIAMGAHFFSDVIYAGVFMLLTSSLLFIAMYGRTAAREFWQSLGFRQSN